MASLGPEPTLSDLQEMLQRIEDARSVIVVNPDDEQTARQAVAMLPFGIIAPRVEVNPNVPAGQAYCFTQGRSDG